jgi:itaconate CoA-transferase
MSTPLAGVRVISLEQAAAAPLCTRRLVLAGAEVIKIEREEGDFARGYDTAVHGQSSYFVWLNAGKKSVVLDLKRTADVDQLKKLISLSDVLVQNLKPGALAKLGIDLTELHAQQPKLISVSVSGFAPSGPGSERKAYDLLMQAESGLAEITGSHHEAGRVGISIVDVATGMYAYEAVLEALLVRHGSQQGMRISVSLFDAVGDLLTVPYLLERYGGQAPKRVGLAHPGICPYGVFSSSDGVRFVLSVQNEREWRRLCNVALADDELGADPRCLSNELRVENRPFVDGRLTEAFGAANYSELQKRLTQADLAFAPVNPIDALKHHPDFHSMTVTLGDETVALPVVPGLEKPDLLPVPSLGEHSEEVLNWLDSQQQK